MELWAASSPLASSLGQADLLTQVPFLVEAQCKREAKRPKGRASCEASCIHPLCPSGQKMGKSCKVVVCGQASVGKTSILEQLLYGNHVVGSEMIETQEDIYVGSIETDRGMREQVRFYDTRGLRDGMELPKHCFSCTDGYVLVYSIDSKESFKRVEILKKEIDKSKDKKEVTIVVLGNKCDLQEQRRVDHEAVQHWAKAEKVKLWEISVADRRTLIEPFVYLASKMTQPQSKSAFPLSRKNKSSGSVDG